MQRRELNRRLGAALSHVARPERFVQQQLRRVPNLPFAFRLAWEALPYPQYAYGLEHAARQASRLGLEAMTAIEFGVAGGNGLLALEAHAADVEALHSVRIDIAGFDTGGGMPPPADHRDVPYFWQEGHYRMDVEQLRARLTRARLHLGDVGTTISAFADDDQASPVGFISFDLDYYSSTVAALEVLELAPERLLPRVLAYFDDIVGNDEEYHSRFAGELLAIEEFNAGHEQRKLAPINGLAHKRLVSAAWHDEMYVAHLFDHPMYDRYVGEGDQQLPLAQRRALSSR